MAETPQKVAAVTPLPMTNILKTRLWINLALLAGIAGLALLLWLNPGKTPRPSVPISALNKSDVQTIDILIGDRPPIALEKHGDDWQLVEPFHIAANTSRVNAILNLLTTHAAVRYPAEHLDLEEFGLLPPAAVVRFDRAEFDFGAAAPFNGKRYILHDNVLYLIEDFIYPMLNTDLGALVSRQLVPASNRVSGFELSSFSLHKTSGGWSIQPENPNLSADDLQAWVDTWLTAQAVLVRHQPLPAANNRRFVSVRFDNGNSIRYQIFDQGEEPILYRTDPDLQYSLSPAIFHNLVNDPLPTAMEFDPDSMIPVSN